MVEWVGQGRGVCDGGEGVQAASERGVGPQSAPRAHSHQAADVWSAGVVLYILLTAAYPFGRSEDDGLRADRRLHAMLQRTLDADWPRTELAALVSPSCLDVLDRMLTLDPAVRATLADVQRHPWWVGGGGGVRGEPGSGGEAGAC